MNRTVTGYGVNDSTELREIKEKGIDTTAGSGKIITKWGKFLQLKEGILDCLGRKNVWRK